MATLTLTGPHDKWFALSLGSPHFDMADKPYTIVVDGKGNVQERKLGDHDPGQVLTASLRVLSNSVVDGERKVVVSRPFKGHTNDHFTFDPSTSTIPVLAASGNGANFGYHGAKQRTGGRLQLSGVDSPTCLCDTGRKGSIEGIPFNKHCLDEPFGDLVQQKNPTCWIETYQGGQVLVMIFTKCRNLNNNRSVATMERCCWTQNKTNPMRLRLTTSSSDSTFRYNYSLRLTHIQFTCYPTSMHGENQEK